jgi:hypothetical protein
MRTIHVDPDKIPGRDDLRGARWLVLPGTSWASLRHLTMFAELDGALVAVDARGHRLDLGNDVQRRAVHLLLVDDVVEAARLQASTGITKVIAGHTGPVDDLLW